MVVVFDEKNAKEKMEKFQKRKHNFDIVFKVSSAVGIGSALVLIANLTFEFPDWLFMSLMALLVAGLIAQHWAGKEFRAAPEPIVAYWMAIQGKKVLEVKAEDVSPSWEKRMAVSVVTEGADGVVGTSFIGVLKQMESTRVREVTVDLNEGVVYVPYRKA